MTEGSRMGSLNPIINAMPKGRWLALHQAAWWNATEVGQMLLPYGLGADPELQNGNKKTAGDVACDRSFIGWAVMVLKFLGHRTEDNACYYYLGEEQLRALEMVLHTHLGALSPAAVLPWEMLSLICGYVQDAVRPVMKCQRPSCSPRIVGMRCCRLRNPQLQAGEGLVVPQGFLLLPTVVTHHACAARQVTVVVSSSAVIVLIIISQSKITHEAR